MSDDRTPPIDRTPRPRELTERERLVEEGHRRAHLERTPGQFVLTLTASGQIAHAIGLDTVLGHAPRTWIGRQLRDLLDGSAAADDPLPAIQRELALVGRWTSIARCVRGDGTPVTVQLFATPRVDPTTHAPAGYFLSGFAATAQPNLVTEPGSPVVLVADDDPAMRAVLRQMLAVGGYRVVEASSGRDALRRVREGPMPDLLVVDLRMPDGSGGWLVAQVGYEFPALLARTVVISGDASSAAAAHVAARWNCPVLAKPFDGFHLVHVLAMLALLASSSADAA